MAEMTNYTFGEVYNISVMEFFTYVSYLRMKARKEEQKMREWKIKNKIH